MAIVLIPLLFLGNWFMAVLVALLAYIAGYELLSMYQKDNSLYKKLRYIAPFWSVVTILMSYADKTLLMPSLILGILMFLIVPIFNKAITMKMSMQMIFAYIYSGCLLGLTLVIRNITDLRSSNSYPELGFYLLAYMLIVTMTSDMGAYISGRLFGRHKLCPTISPNKTIEGAIGGTIISVIVGTICYYLFSNLYQAPLFEAFSSFNKYLHIVSIVGISLVLSIFGQLGDLVASKMKREWNMKDYGNIFPGHGGILDRFDSTILASTIFVVICLFLGVI